LYVKVSFLAFCIPVYDEIKFNGIPFKVYGLVIDLKHENSFFPPLTTFGFPLCIIFPAYECLLSLYLAERTEIEGKERKKIRSKWKEKWV